LHASERNDGDPANNSGSKAFRQSLAALSPNPKTA